MTTPAASAPQPTPAPGPTPTPGPASTETAYTPPATQADLDRILGQRLNQERAKFGGLSGDDVTAMKAELDTLKAASGTDMERAVTEAKTAAEKASADQYLPMLAQARIEGAAAGRVTAEALTKALEYTDLSRFVVSGQVDTGKVAEFVNSIAPATTTTVTAPRGPLIPAHTTAAAEPVTPGDGARAALAKRGIKLPSN